MLPRHRRPRIKLITLPWELDVPTLSLASLAAVTPPEFDVAIVDLVRERLWLDEEVDLVGLTASTPRIRAAYALAKIFRERGAKVVIGGHHATAMPEEALQHCDAVVCGEGETAWTRICEDFLSSPEKVGGIYRERGPSLSSLPQPRMELMRLERYSRYTYPIIASRGCPDACSFCFAKRMTQGFRTYPISHVLEQIRRRPKATRALYFVDDNLAGDIDYARELFRALARDPVPFGMQVRHELAFDIADLHLARSAGCVLISCGYESLNQDTLEGTGKRAVADHYRTVARNIFEAGIIPSGNWMFGFDWDEEDVFPKVLEFLDGADLLHCNFSTEIPFPGTSQWVKYQREGRILTDDYSRYLGRDSVVVKPVRMSPEALQRGIRWLSQQYYSPWRVTRRGVRAVRNPAFHGRLTPLQLMGLNYAQVIEWYGHTVPALKWLSARLVSVNRYRYLRDLFPRTNFRRPRLAPAGSPALAEGASPFYTRSGHKRGPRSPLVLEAPPAAPAADRDVG